MEAPTFEPATLPLLAISGATFARAFKLWANEARTEPFSLAGYTVKLEIDGVKTLTEGDGLEIDADEGEITAVLSATETATAAPARGTRVTRWRLLIEKAGSVSYLARGAFTFEQP